MSDSEKKYPKEVKAIYIAGAEGEKGREIDVDSSESDRPSNVSKMYRGWDREARAMSMAAREFFKTYLDLHEASNEETKDGAIKHLGKNTVKAHKAAFKVLKNNSKLFTYDPSEINDNIVEYMEDLEDEYKDDDED